MTMNRHEPWEELISSSLNGDLTDDERRRLDGHLDGCPACRATLAAFTDQRRIMAGLRHVPPPRDLGARVRTGIERGAFATLPWWRRPAAIFAGVGGGLAVMAGALLAIVLLNAPTDEPQIGATATPSPEVSAATPEPTSPPPFPTGPTPTLAASVEPASPAPTPTPSATPEPASPEPDVYLAFTGPHDNLALTVRHGPTGETTHEVDTPSGPPIAAELSPDGQWLAYITRVGDSGLNEVRATRLSEGTPSNDPEDPAPAESPVGVGETVLLGESVAGSPFLENLFWSSNGYYLTYTVADPAGAGTDVWMFDVSFGEPRQITDVGNAYAASWLPESAGTSFTWVSTAGEEPMSYLLGFHDSAGDPDDPMLGGARDPAEDPTAAAAGVFQPLLSPNGSLAIYWNGRMERSGDEWLFSEGGAPYLAEHDANAEFANERHLFSDVTVGRNAFTSAAITWGGDGDAYAVWNARWTGVSQASDGPYPDPTRVYFGHATDERGVTRDHAIDEGDVPEGNVTVDVKVSPTGDHLVITALRPIGGALEAPRADLLLVRRNTGLVADDVVVIRPADDGWFGPAGFDDDPAAGDLP